MTERHLVGVISDTHGLMRPEALHALQGVERIVHAGDVGKPEVLEALNQIAPVTAVRGNVDHGPWAARLPETEVITIGEATLYILHDLNSLPIDPAAAGFQAVIYGHSHRAASRLQGRILYLNPGSAGPRRFALPASVARLVIADGRIEAELIQLEG